VVKVEYQPVSGTDNNGLKFWIPMVQWRHFLNWIKILSRPENSAEVNSRTKVSEKFKSDKWFQCLILYVRLGSENRIHAYPRKQ